MISRLAPLALTSLLFVSSNALVLAAPPAKKPATPNLSAAYNAYLSRLRGKVLNVWNPVDGKNNVVLQAVVGTDGSVSDLTLTSTPSNADAETAANGAFVQCQPLEPLPPNSPNAKLTLTFDSYSDPHGDSSSNLSTRLDPIAPPKLQPAEATPE